MKANGLRRGLTLLAGVVCAAAVYGYNYDVKQPSDALRPQWSGAKAGVWTMDYEAAAAKAKATGKLHIMLVTASWWCPYCQNFEKKVGLSDAWKNYIAEKGCYLSMMDYPYRFHVDDDQIGKSKYPELGDGWGFQCWLYNDAYLAENGLSAEDGFKAIQRFYDRQNELALDTAEVNTLRLLDGSGDFILKKIAYPTLIVYLPDGTEAGRFTAAASIYKMSPEDAQDYVIKQIDTIVSKALDAQCGLCSDPEADECGFTGESAQRYFGWLSGDESGVLGLIEVTTGKMNPSTGAIKVKSVVTMAGKKTVLNAVAMNGCGNVQLSQGRDAGSAAVLKIGAFGLSGSYTDGQKQYKVTGARHVFSIKKGDAEANERVAALTKGVWSLAMRPEVSDDPSIGGFGALTVDVRGAGRASVKGKLGDGTSVSFSGQLIAGEDGVFSLPVLVNPYPGKKGGFSCNLWFKNGWLINVTDVGIWKRVQKDADIAVKWSPVYAALPGTGTVSNEMELIFNEPLGSLRGEPLTRDPNTDIIMVKKNSWVGTDASSFAVSFAPKTSVISGSMGFYTQKTDGKERKTSATVYGVVLGGTGYGMVLVKNVGSWAVRVSACAACDE